MQPDPYKLAADLSAALDAATPGERCVDTSNTLDGYYITVGDPRDGRALGALYDLQEAQLHALAHNTLRPILAELERLRRENEELRADAQRWRDQERWRKEYRPPRLESQG